MKHSVVKRFGEFSTIGRKSRFVSAVDPRGLKSACSQVSTNLSNPGRFLCPDLLFLTITIILVDGGRPANVVAGPPDRGRLDNCDWWFIRPFIHHDAAEETLQLHQHVRYTTGWCNVAWALELVTVLFEYESTIDRYTRGEY